MLETYIPLFNSAIMSSLWSLSGDCLKIFLQLALQADPDGCVVGSVDGVARIAGMPVADVERHLLTLSSPDRYSKDRTRSDQADGRRIEPIPNGWRVLNIPHYRNEAKRVGELARKRRWWNENRGASGIPVEAPTRRTETDTETETETETERESPDPERARDQGSENPRPKPRTQKVASRPAKAPPRAPLPHEAAEARQAAKRAPEATGAQPVLRYKFRSDWQPSKDHRARGLELGLTDTEILLRADDCLLKPIKQGFFDEDEHFMRELTWARSDRETKKAKEQHANRKDFELPGHNRK